MSRPTLRQRGLIGLLAVAPLLGTWVGHTLEYLRVWGIYGLRAEFFGSVHAYMPPLGLALLLLGAASAGSVQRLSVRLESQLTHARGRLRGVLRHTPQPAEAPASIQRTHWATRLLLLGLAFSVLQISLYLTQENLEALSVHVAAPGFGVITGIHDWAAVVQAAVAFNMAAIVVLALQAVSSRRSAIARVERLVLALSRQLRRDHSPVQGWAQTRTVALLVRSAWGRAPPLTVPL